MYKYTVIKRLVLVVEVEAEDDDKAVDLVASMDDIHFDILDCEYTVEDSRK